MDSEKGESQMLVAGIRRPPQWQQQQQQLDQHVRYDEDEEGSTTSSADRFKKYLDFCVYFSFIFLALLFLTGTAISLHFFLLHYYGAPGERYHRLRSQLISRERERRVGGSLDLGVQEELANERLLNIRAADLENSEKHVLRDFEPRPHFLSKYRINETDLYEMLRSMPKGGLLHVHDSGMFKTALLIKLCHSPDLWVCVSVEDEFEAFRFSKVMPAPKRGADYECVWKLMKDYWVYEDVKKREEKLRRILRLDAYEYADKREVVQRLKRMNRLVQGLISYRPVWSNYIFSMLEDFLADGVMYVELRSSLPVMYDLKGTNYTILDTAETTQMVTSIFKTTHCGFIDMKLIYAPVREINGSDVDQFLANAQLLKRKFPGFLVGFDLVALDDECNLPLLQDYIVKMLHISKEVDFYFHAGESFCYNSTVADDNLIDALLLGSKRIGNSLAVPMHPEIMRIVELLHIAVEVCPLSNHYLQYISDFHRHPAAYLIAAGFPVVVGSDYPYFWNAAPLTDDFYVAFVGVASAYGNLSLLKQLAMNSFIYSSMGEIAKARAMDLFMHRWNKWILKFLDDRRMPTLTNNP